MLGAGVTEVSNLSVVVGVAVLFTMQTNAEEEQACKRKLHLCRRQAEFEGLFGYLGWDGQAF